MNSYHLPVVPDTVAVPSAEVPLAGLVFQLIPVSDHVVFDAPKSDTPTFCVDTESRPKTRRVVSNRVQPGQVEPQIRLTGVAGVCAALDEQVGGVVRPAPSVLPNAGCAQEQLAG